MSECKSDEGTQKLDKCTGDKGGGRVLPRSLPRVTVKQTVDNILDECSLPSPVASDAITDNALSTYQ